MQLLRCLWLAREIPFPANSGDRIYSGKLAESLSAAGVEVSFLGLTPIDRVEPPVLPNMTWIEIEGFKKTNLRALISRFPLVSAAHDTTEMRTALRAQLELEWDAIVLDHYGCAWMLAEVLKAAKAATRPILITHVSHNFETKLAFSLLLANRTRIFRALILLQNFWKIRFWERRMARSVDVLTSITSEDSESFRSVAPDVVRLTLTPGYSGVINPFREIRDSTSRAVVLIGSYRWGVKELNLRQLIDAADGPFHKANISLEIIGSVPEGLLKDYEDRVKSCHFHGFVDDYGPYLDNARIALVPEIVGGGFKLKFLDYIFSGMPVATIAEASAGLPEGLRKTFIQAEDMDDLVVKVIASIDDLTALNRMKSDAYEAARNQFSWRDRGELLRATLFRETREF